MGCPTQSRTACGTGWWRSSPNRPCSTPTRCVPSSTLADLGIDLLGLVEAVFAIEEAFDIQVPFNANEPARSEFDISSVDAIVRAVEKLIAAKD